MPGAPDTPMYSLRTRSEDSFLLVYRDDSGNDIVGAATSAPSAVSPVESFPSTESNSANDIVEARLGDIYMRQLVIFKKKDGKDYVFEEGQIDTGNDAEFMLVGKRLVKELGLKEEPLLGGDELQGINGPSFRPTSFVRMEFRMPQLELDWVNTNAYVIEGNVGFNLGNRAISKFGLLGKLLELEQVGKGWVKLNRRGTTSRARPVTPVLSSRSQAQREKDARKHQERSQRAAEHAAFREQWQRTAACRPSNSQSGQSTYASSIESYSISSTTASTIVDVASSSHASTCSTSATSISTESSGQKRKT